MAGAWIGLAALLAIAAVALLISAIARRTDRIRRDGAPILAHDPDRDEADHFGHGHGPSDGDH